jgi:RND family efflux transporter MFP subunit
MTVTLTDYVRHAVRHLHPCICLAPLIPAACLLVLTVILTGCGDKSRKPAAPARPVRVVIAPLPSASATEPLTGEIRAQEEVTLGFRLDGRVLSRAVDVGDPVVAGQVLASQESDTSRNQLNSAQADLDSARAAEQVAAQNLRRMQLLMPGGAIARTQLDSAQSDWQAARSRRLSSEDSLKTARENLSWAQLTAPADGVITQVSVAAGQVVSAGQTVVTLASGCGRDAVFDVARPQSFSQQTGGTFNVSLLSDPSVVTTGHLRDISPQADPQTRTWRVRLTLDNPPPAMALGASVQLSLVHAGQPVIALPASALTRAGGYPALFIVNTQTQTLHLRPVVLEGYSASDIFISSGLSPGEKVVIAGVSQLREGEKVLPGENAG